MQDAFVRDMYNLSEVNNPRYNGHVQVSSCGKSTAGGKRDRKGCTKGKIEAIMKNNSVRAKVVVAGPGKKSVMVNHVPYSLPVKHEDRTEEDPYTFTEPEPQPPSIYHHPSLTLPPPPPPPAPPYKKSVTLAKAPVADKNVTIKSDPIRVSAPLKVIKILPEPTRPRPKKRRTEPPKSNSVHLTVPSTSPSMSVTRDPNNVTIPAKREARKSTWQRERNSKHELLERIHKIQAERKQYTRDLYPLGVEQSDSDSDELESSSEAVYERQWITHSVIGDEKSPREQRIEATRSLFRRRLAQTIRGLKMAEELSSTVLAAVVAAARKYPNATAGILEPNLRNGKTGKSRSKVKPGTRYLTVGEKCSYSEGCHWQALPCTRHCFRHIMYNVDQKLFSHCTGRTGDNTQCNRPTFDVRHDPPLCPLHASNHDSTSRLSSEPRHHKKVSKKSRILGSSRNAKKNNKKRKKSGSHSSTDRSSHSDFTLSASPSLSSLGQKRNPTPVEMDPRLSQLSLDETDPLTRSVVLPTGVENLLNSHSQPHSEDIVEEEVLAIANLDPVEFASQASRLLEEHDLTNVLNQISADAFNDLFTDKNGEYEPTREETEELERALEAVNNDVRSLERMSMGGVPCPLPLLQLPLPLDPISLLDESEGFPPFQNGLGGVTPGPTGGLQSPLIVPAPPPSSVMTTDINHS